MLLFIDFIVNIARGVVRLVLDVAAMWLIYAIIALLGLLAFELCVGGAPDVDGTMQMVFLIGLPLAIIVVLLPQRHGDEVRYMRPFSAMLNPETPLGQLSDELSGELQEGAATVVTNLRRRLSI